jgi:hypothetical protein
MLPQEPGQPWPGIVYRHGVVKADQGMIEVSSNETDGTLFSVVLLRKV